MDIFNRTRDNEIEFGKFLDKVDNIYRNLQEFEDEIDLFDIASIKKSFRAKTDDFFREDRKLLLTKKEIKSLAKEVLTPGLTIVPTLLFINEKGFCKVKIALCKGKKEFDKRESIKEKDNKRELDRIMKNY